MYNRYIRNDRGTYPRIPEADASVSSGQHPEPQAAPNPHQNIPQAEPGPQPCSPPPQENSGSITYTLRRLLDRFHLDSIDSGDLLLLLLLFLLFREDADEELLFALGLLLIL